MFDYLMGIVCYCMVVVGDKVINKIYFVGGLINLYNYNGIGYNVEFLIVDDVIWIFDIVEGIWVILKIEVEVFMMDYCGLINVNGFWVIIGGMFGVQFVISKVILYFLIFVEVYCLFKSQVSFDVLK